MLFCIQVSIGEPKSIRATVNSLRPYAKKQQKLENGSLFKKFSQNSVKNLFFLWRLHRVSFHIKFL